MMRRRALLAASGASGGGGGEEPFYAELFYDYCEDHILYIQCYRAPDELGIALFNEMVRLLEKYGQKENANFFTLSNPQQYGFNVTIEGGGVTEIIYDHGGYGLYYGEFNDYVMVWSDGTLRYEY